MMALTLCMMALTLLSCDAARSGTTRAPTLKSRGERCVQGAECASGTCYQQECVDGGLNSICDANFSAANAAACESDAFYCDTAVYGVGPDFTNRCVATGAAGDACRFEWHCASSRCQDSGLCARWTDRSAGNNVFRAVHYANGLWVVVGNDHNYTSGALYTSTDGATWTGRSAGSATFSDVHYANGLWVAVGDGVLYTSTDDGTTWASRSVVSNAFLYDVHYANGLWVAVELEGTFYTSTDGATWTEDERAPPNVQYLYAVHYANGRWVAVGDGGAVLTAP